MEATAFVRFGFAAFLILAAFACGSPMGSQSPDDVRIAVDSPVVRFDRDISALDAVIPLRISNPSAQSVFFEYCGTALHRLIGGRWVQVWLVICTNEPPPGTEIPAGATVTIPIRVQALLGRGFTRDWMAPASGDYRMTVSLTDGKSALPERTRESPRFNLKVE